MKYKTTNKEIRATSARIYFCGYCGMHSLLRGAGVEPFAYAAGVYGWNYDAYRVGGVTILDGYRSTPAEYGTQHIPGLQENYEKKAELIHKNYKRPYAERRKDCEALLNEFIEQIKI